MKIKTCPFCGATAEAIQDTASDYKRDWTWFIMCNGPKEHHLDLCSDTEEEAINEWNERSLKEKLDVILNEN